MERDVYWHEEVRLPAAAIVSALREHGPELLGRAMPDGVRSSLHFEMGGTTVAREVRIEVGEPTTEKDATVFPVHWRASSHDGLFPVFSGQLEISEMSSLPVTQVSLIGQYSPPMSVLGSWGDNLFGHNLAEQSVKNFVHDLAGRLGSQT